MNDFDDPSELAAWLRGQTSLAPLRERFQAEWAFVEKEIVEALQTRDKKRLDRLLRPLPPTQRHHARRGRRAERQDAMALCATLIKQRMAALAIEDVVKSSLPSGQSKSLGLLDRALFRLLFFTRDHRRKLVSNRLFRLFWPLVRKPDRLMLEAEARGIYCFFSKDFIAALAKLIGTARCIEIAAGDGALARALRAEGASVLASDDHSWAHKISYPDDVRKQEVRDALQQHDPEVVLCSWPPARNEFERHVFAAPGVQRYIVIGSGHEYAFGNWRVYQNDHGFTMRKAPELAALLLPREFGAAVYIFDRA